MKYAICYVSNASKNLNLQKIKILLDLWEKKNNSLEIKGILLYSEGNFFQILEGERDIVLPLFHKIQKDSRHYGLIQIIGKDIAQGSFDGYIADVLDENSPDNFRVPKEYMEALTGMSPEVKIPMERMLENFIATR